MIMDESFLYWTLSSPTWELRAIQIRNSCGYTEAQKVKAKFQHLKADKKAALFWSEWFCISALFLTDNLVFFWVVIVSAAASWSSEKWNFIVNYSSWIKQPLLNPNVAPQMCGLHSIQR